MKATVSDAILRWVLVAVFTGWACILAVVVFGEQAADSEASVFEFLIIKLMGICSTYASCKAGVWCYRKRLFPKQVNNYVKWALKNEE